LHSFFAVHEGKIVDESCSLSSTEALILKRREDDEPIWHSKPHFDEAWETYCYRKFYAETVTGQLMVLRPDEPILYNYGRAERDVTRDVGFVTLLKIYRLLWIAVPLLAAIAFPMTWPYMAIFASLSAVNLLWTLWETR